MGGGGNSGLRKLGQHAGGTGEYEGEGEAWDEARKPGRFVLVGLGSQGASCLPWELWREHGESGT